jgi:phage tail-like protein
MTANLADPAITVCFSVQVDRHDLGAFTGCDGLGCEVTIEQREEGGNNGFVHQLAGRIRYSNVKLSRFVNADTSKVSAWFASMTGGVQRTTARIVAMDPHGDTVAEWSLIDVIPVRWQGPSLSVDSPNGFLDTR